MGSPGYKEFACLFVFSIGANVGSSSETENLKSRNKNVITAKAN